MSPAAYVPTESGQESRLRDIALSVAAGFRTLSAGAGGGTEYIAGALVWHSLSRMHTFNGAVITDPGILRKDSLDEIGRFFRGKGKPYSLVTADGLVPGAEEALRHEGYSELDDSPVMWLDGPATRWQPGPQGLQVARVETPQQLADFRDLVERVFSIGQEELDLVLAPASLQVEGISHYVGSLASRTICSATLVTAGPVASIWNVATDTEYRRRGLAAEIMHVLVADALAAGHKSTLLLASQQGIPLYERLGYSIITHLRMHVPA